MANSKGLCPYRPAEPTKESCLPGNAKAVRREGQSISPESYCSSAAIRACEGTLSQAPCPSHPFFCSPLRYPGGLSLPHSKASKARDTHSTNPKSCVSSSRPKSHKPRLTTGCILRCVCPSHFWTQPGRIILQTRGRRPHSAILAH